MLYFAHWSMLPQLDSLADGVLISPLAEGALGKPSSTESSQDCVAATSYFLGQALTMQETWGCRVEGKCPP